MKLYYESKESTLFNCDVLAGLGMLDDCSVQCCVTSPPYYGLRDYGTDGQIGLEETPEQYVAKLVEVFREVRRVLRDDGTLWLNLGDSYASGGGKFVPQNAPCYGYQQHTTRAPSVHGLPNKNLIGIPWRVAFALQADGWWLRQDIIWHKPNPMPESVIDRCTKAHEYVFLLSKSARYYYDADAIAEPSITPAGLSWEERKAFPPTKNAGVTWRNDVSQARAGTLGNGVTRNRRSVWTVTTKPYSGAHFATMPPDLAEICVKAGSAVGDLVLDPFVGSGTTLAVAILNSRRGVGIDLNADYLELAKKRILKATNRAHPPLLRLIDETPEQTSLF